MMQVGTQSVALRRDGANLALATLFLGMFVWGSGELLVVGLLNRIAGDLRVSIPAAGVLVTAYALGLAVGGPVLTALTIRLDRRAILVGALALLVVCTLVPVLTTSYGLFVAMRAVVGALHGLFVAVGFVLATSLVAPERMGRAISVVVSGLFVSTALGVPLGTRVGQVLGWRGSFTAVAVLGVAALVATLLLIPAAPGSGGGAASQARYAFAPRVLGALLVNVLAFAAVYSALTYVVPFLTDVTDVSDGMVSVFLLAYGVATAVGSLAGGRFADRNAARTLVVGAVGVAASLLALQLVGTVAVLVAPALVAFGLFAMGMVPSMQYRVVSLAGPGGQLASSLPAAAANMGIALGAYAGGLAYGAATASAPVLTGLAIAVIAVLAAWGAAFLKPPVAPAAAEPAAPASATGEAA